MNTKDPLDSTLDAPDVGTDVPIGPGEKTPEAEGGRRPGHFGEQPPAEQPGPNPGSNPANPGDDPGVAPPLQPPDVIATDPTPAAG